ncbi:hypothetical protein EHS13_16105 [Paenibacillus psychroresistens]|uniref:Uncharacterized protein n=1 Tax=Paenibacillus psychroresistens TaxID=1778678 RepID=A0A6B8RLA5_9BACL|nr:hypothetical protein [Paenibacillus psychroresistens]QGQ96295.1 hypothetical protein EHS13_16105 [Paenibacillus psychroresistens]
MYFHKIRLFFVYLFLLVLLTACGHPIPTASVDLLKQKKAILILTSPSLDKSLQNQLVQTLNTWKQTELITYEWLQQVNVVDDLLINKINQIPYSYIMVISSDLTPTTLTEAGKAPDKRWIVLSDATHLEAIPTTIPDNVAVYQLNASLLTTQWNEAVARTQQAQQQQLTMNGIYHSVGSVTYGNIPTPTPTPSPNIPPINLQKPGAVILIWPSIWADQLKVIQLNSFEKGLHYYTTQQMKINY